MTRQKRSKPTFSDRVAEYVNSGLLGRRLKIGPTLYCTVDGQYGTYRTSATLGPKGVREAACSCPSELYWPCKHVAALAETYRQAPDTFFDLDAFIGGLRGRPHKDLLSMIRAMAAAAPQSLAALGIAGFEPEEDFEDAEAGEV